MGKENECRQCGCLLTPDTTRCPACDLKDPWPRQGGEEEEERLQKPIRRRPASQHPQRRNPTPR